MTFQDSLNVWLYGVPDEDVPASPFNWIRSGTYADGNSPYNDWDMSADNPLDPGQSYERMVEGTWAPYPLVATNLNMDDGHGPAPNGGSSKPTTLRDISSINVVFTADKTKWTRCPVIEMCTDPAFAFKNAPQYTLRRSPSVNKEGEEADPNADPSTNPDDPHYIAATGMGWFPGYAVDIETGERLNVMFSENSMLAAENGRDMKFNPTSNYINFTNFAPIFGGMHYLYIMGHNSVTIGTGASARTFNYPAYDAGAKLYYTFNISPDSLPFNAITIPGIYKSCMYVNIPLAYPNTTWLPEGNDATVKIRVAKPYQRYFSVPLASDHAKNVNNGNPMYQFETTGYESIAFSPEKNASDLDLITVVPNPYYAYADGPGYERNQLDTRVKIINIPTRCVVTIYNINGSLIRQYNVDKSGIPNPSASTNGVDTDPKTSIDWDLKNFAGIPIAGGIYLIHVKETGGRNGERVVKWFGAMRPIDLNTF